MLWFRRFRKYLTCYLFLLVSWNINSHSLVSYFLATVSDLICCLFISTWDGCYSIHAIQEFHKLHSSFVLNEKIAQWNNFGWLQSKKNCKKIQQKNILIQFFILFALPIRFFFQFSCSISSKQQHVSYLFIFLFGIIDSSQ